jgi:hypothetical protein
LLLGCLREAEELRIDLAVPTQTPAPEGTDRPTLPLRGGEASRAASA